LGQLVHDGTGPGHHGDVRDHGLWADRRVPGRDVPDQDSLHFDVAPYHIGNGWFGGVLPLVATALVAYTVDIYYGLWYPIIVSVTTCIVGFLFLRETKDTDIVTSSAQAKMAF